MHFEVFHLYLAANSQMLSWRRGLLAGMSTGKLGESAQDVSGKSSWPSGMPTVLPLSPSHCFPTPCVPVALCLLQLGRVLEW